MPRYIWRARHPVRLPSGLRARTIARLDAVAERRLFTGFSDGASMPLSRAPEPRKEKAAPRPRSLVSGLLLRQSDEQSRNGARPFRNHARHPWCLPSVLESSTKPRLDILAERRSPDIGRRFHASNVTIDVMPICDVSDITPVYQNHHECVR
jgi:hypothetical protein